MLVVAHRVAGARLLEPDRGGDVAGTHFLDLLPLVGVHLQETTDALALVLRRVVDVRAALQHARIDAEEGKLSDERIGRDLERERRERRLVVHGALFEMLVVVREMSLDRLDFDWRREVIDHRIEQRLHALVLERGTAQHRHELHRDGRLANRATNFVVGQLCAVEVLLHQLFVVLHRGFYRLVASQLAGLLVLLRHVHHGERLAERRIVEDVLLALDDVDVAREELTRPHGELQRERPPAEAIPDHPHAADEIGAGPIHLVREDHARDLVAVRLAPHRLRLRLYAGNRIQQRNRAVEHTQRPFDLYREVDVSRSVDDVDAVLRPRALFVGLAVTHPEAGRGGRGDRDAALLLLLHPVHRRGAFMHLADLVALTGIIKNTLGSRRLAGIDVCHDADVTVILERGNACHIYPSGVSRGGPDGASDKIK